MTTKILAILQARMGSTRLPGKVLKPILGEPMLARQIERIRRAATIDRLVVATSTDRSDDPVAALCAQLGVDCFRGSLADVLDRFCKAAERYRPEQVVRLTGDCPLIDPGVIDAVVRFHLAGGYDYSSNTIHPTFPDGLDVEIFPLCLPRPKPAARLRRPFSANTSRLSSTGSPQRYRLGDFRYSPDLSALRWTVDNPEDFELVCRIYAALYPSNPNFALDDILALFENNPDLAKINAGYWRNEGSIEPPSPNPRRS